MTIYFCGVCKRYATGPHRCTEPDPRPAVAEVEPIPMPVPSARRPAA